MVSRIRPSSTQAPHIDYLPRHRKRSRRLLLPTPVGRPRPRQLSPRFLPVPPPRPHRAHSHLACLLPAFFWICLRGRLPRSPVPWLHLGVCVFNPWICCRVSISIFCTMTPLHPCAVSVRLVLWAPVLQLRLVQHFPALACALRVLRQSARSLTRAARTVCLRPRLPSWPHPPSFTSAVGSFWRLLPPAGALFGWKTRHPVCSGLILRLWHGVARTLRSRLRWRLALIPCPLINRGRSCATTNPFLPWLPPVLIPLDFTPPSRVSAPPMESS